MPGSMDVDAASLAPFIDSFKGRHRSHHPFHIPFPSIPSTFFASLPFFSPVWHSRQNGRPLVVIGCRSGLVGLAWVAWPGPAWSGLAWLGSWCPRHPTSAIRRQSSQHAALPCFHSGWPGLVGSGLLVFGAHSSLLTAPCLPACLPAISELDFMAIALGTHTLSHLALSQTLPQHRSAE